MCPSVVIAITLSPGYSEFSIISDESESITADDYTYYLLLT